MQERIVAVPTLFLPVDQARKALLPPMRLVRAAAVVVARTVRHWELALEGEDPNRDVAPLLEALQTGGVQRPDRTGTSDGSQPVTGTATDELPVEDWPELSYADAQARLSGCDEDDLRALLEYERSHGHRPQYTLLLEQRLADRA